MGICYFVVNPETKERFELTKFHPATSVDWSQIETNPDALAFDIHKQWIEYGNQNFDYPWCLALVQYMRTCFTKLSPLEVVLDSSDDFWQECKEVGSRHDNFKG